MQKGVNCFINLLKALCVSAENQPKFTLAEISRDEIRPAEPQPEKLVSRSFVDKNSAQGYISKGVEVIACFLFRWKIPLQKLWGEFWLK
jgi:hypothetical protein